MGRSGLIRLRKGTTRLRRPLVLSQPFAVVGKGAAVSRVVYDGPDPAIQIEPGGDVPAASALAHTSSISGVTVENSDGYAVAAFGVKNLGLHDVQLVSGTWNRPGAGCLFVGRGRGSASIHGTVRCHFGRNVVTIDGSGAPLPWANANALTLYVQGSRDTQVGVRLRGSQQNRLVVFVQRAAQALVIDEGANWNLIDLMVEANESPIHVDCRGWRYRIVGAFLEDRSTAMPGNTLEGVEST